jgi:hypothetical protein
MLCLGGSHSIARHKDHLSGVGELSREILTLASASHRLRACLGVGHFSESADSTPVIDRFMACT